MTNTSKECLSFKWSLDYNFEQSGNFYAYIQDFNLHWHFDVLSSCGYNFPNEILPGDTMAIRVSILKNDLFSGDLNSPPVIKFNLMSSPDCGSIINTVVFKEMVTSTTFEEVNLIEPYPNPVTDLIFIENYNLENGNFKIVNIGGQLVKEGSIANQQIDVNDLSQGIYLLQLNIGNEILVWRFVKNGNH